MSELSRLRGSEGYAACSDEVMAHRPIGSTQIDRIRLPYTARRLSFSRYKMNRMKRGTFGADPGINSSQNPEWQ